MGTAINSFFFISLFHLHLYFFDVFVKGRAQCNLGIPRLISGAFQKYYTSLFNRHLLKLIGISYMSLVQLMFNKMQK